MQFRLEVRLTTTDIGSRVVIRWRRPAPSGADEIADVIGLLEAADEGTFQVRKLSGELVTIPVERALAGKTVPPRPGRSSARQAPGER